MMEDVTCSRSDRYK